MVNPLTADTGGQPSNSKQLMQRYIQQPCQCYLLITAAGESNSVYYNVPYQVYNSTINNSHTYM